ncbi:MAG TPA: hypothetical protein VH442_09480 [Micromonosporaceae bacterium]|jgi:hypothetical protein
MEPNEVEIWYGELPEPLRYELRTGYPGDSRISAEVVDAISAEHAPDSQRPWFRISESSFQGVSAITYRAISPLSRLMYQLRERGSRPHPLY